MMTNAVAITGFLGSGKTTLTLALALALNARGARVAIIENERGGLGIDGAFLEAQGLNVRELRAGCVCCELVLPLRQTITLLRERFAPDWLILEASGVANADALRASVDTPPYPDLHWQFIAVLDTARFDKLWGERYGLGTLIRPQVAQADLLLLSKIEQVSEAKLLAIAEAVSAQRPDAALLPFVPEDEPGMALILAALMEPTNDP